MRKSELNIEIVPESLAGKYDLPRLKGGSAAPPGRMLPFNMAKTATDTNAGIHFFIDDYRFERIWNQPDRYIEIL